MSKIDLLKEFLKPEEEKWLYQDGDTITEEELKLIRNATCKQKMELFKKCPTSNPIGYKITFKCEKCGEYREVNWSKTKLLDKKVGLICKNCIQREEEERNIQRQESQKKAQIDKQAKTEEYIGIYLNTAYSWKDGVKQYQKWQETDVYGLEVEKIAEHIRGMNYRDFLQTPYWKAISSQVMKRNNYRCQLCGKQGLLNVHHASYDIHGYERQNYDKLVCLCEDCHQIHHKVLSATE